MVTHIRIDIFSVNNTPLLGELHSIKIGPEGLLGVPDRIGYAAGSLLCFPSKEEACNLTFRGDPFPSICSILVSGSGASISATLTNAGYYISEASVAQIWIRADGLPKSCSDSIGNSFAQTGSFTDDRSTKVSRQHLPADVKARMKSLCNDICPRNEDGIMLPEKGPGNIKRPAWCIHAIMNILNAEFDELKLKGAYEKALAYMARSALQFKRLKNLTTEEWERMREQDKVKQRTLLSEYELAADEWKRGPYGAIWDGGKLRRQPTDKEIDDYKFRVHAAQCSLTTEPKR